MKRFAIFIVLVTASSAILTGDTKSHSSIQLLWKTALNYDGGMVAVADGLVYLSNCRTIRAVDAQTGQLRWKSSVLNDLTGVPSCWAAVSGGLAILGITGYDENRCYLGHLFAVDALTGKERWHFEINAEYTGLAALNDTLYASTSRVLTNNEANPPGTPYGAMSAFDLQTGKVKWEMLLQDSGIARMIWDDPMLYFVSTNALIGGNYIYALDPQTRQEKWKKDYREHHTTLGSPTAASGIVYYINDYTLYVRDDQDGHLKWKYDTGVNLSSDIRTDLAVNPVTDGDQIYVDLVVGSENNQRPTDVQHYIQALDVKTGKETWRTPMYFESGQIITSLTLAGDYLLIGNWRMNDYEYSGPYYLYALNRRSGQLDWRFQIDVGTRDKPLFAEGVIYLLDDRSNLYALHLSRSDAP